MSRRSPRDATSLLVVHDGRFTALHLRIQLGKKLGELVVELPLKIEFVGLVELVVAAVELPELRELRGTREVVETHRLTQAHLSVVMTFVLEQARCFTLLAAPKRWNQR
eukprot:s1333_g9.t1